MALIGIFLVFGGLAVAITSYIFASGPASWHPYELNANQIKMMIELFKFSITSVLVGGAALIYKGARVKIVAERETAVRAASLEEEKIIERAEKRATLKQQREIFFEAFTNTYNEIKFWRRELTREIIEQNDGSLQINFEKYCEIMRNLNQGQLELERYKRLSRFLPEYLQPISTISYDSFKSAEKYLRKVTREYEQRECADVVAKSVVISRDSKVYGFCSSRSANPTAKIAYTEFFIPLDKVFNGLATNTDDLNLYK